MFFWFFFLLGLFSHVGVYPLPTHSLWRTDVEEPELAKLQESFSKPQARYFDVPGKDCADVTVWRRATIDDWLHFELQVRI